MMAENYSKRFMEWVTGSKNNLFLWTRLKLTFLYIFFIAVILIVFSVGLYVSMNKNIKDSISDKKKDNVDKQYVIAQNDAKLREALLSGNVLLLLLSGGLAFFVAGRNLKPIKTALEKQKRFTADASHDLRTPLAIMKMDCEVSLKKKTVSMREHQELVESNLEEINRMSEMVEQLLFLSRNNGILNQQLEIINLNAVMTSVVSSFKNLAENKNISLNVQISDDGCMKGDRLNLEKMFLNIMKNALEYTSVGGKIEVNSNKNGSKMEISIADDGIGIASDDLLHITEPFYKLDKARGQKNDGSGLGLSIVDEIVKSHDGELLIESELNQGTIVRLAFPLIERCP